MKINLLLASLCITQMHIFAMESKKLTISYIEKKINSASQKNNYIKARQWFDRLSLLAGADWKYFNLDQKEKYGDIYSNLYDIIEKLKSSNRQSTTNTDVLDVIAVNISAIKKEASWLIEKLNQNQCDIEWSEMLDNKVSFPSPEELKKNRIENLAQTGLIKKMNNDN
ncbi:MAG: hypothetical protein WDZ41_02635 [Candidatus Babeliales bacterium]